MHTHIYIYGMIYIYICIEREREREICARVASGNLYACLCESGPRCIRSAKVLTTEFEMAVKEYVFCLASLSSFRYMFEL